MNTFFLPQLAPDFNIAAHIEPIALLQSTENIYEPEYQSGYDSSYDIQFIFYDEEECEEEEELDEDIIAPLDISPSGQSLQNRTR